MAAKKSKRAKAGDRVKDAAVEYFAARSHDAWRRTLLKTSPEQKGQPRMRMRGGVMVDVNQPWSKLHAKAKRDNMRAAADAYDAVRKFPDDREAAANFVHQRWIDRNKGDKSQPKALFKPYAKLPEVEKDKDRVHVDVMQRALRAVQKAPSSPARKPAKAAPRRVAVEIDASAWRKLEAAAAKLSKTLGRPVAPDVLLRAGIDAVTALSAAVIAEERARK
ncbi:MAG: hypothetical protein JNJ63_04055 [Hyphomonadaceae bacterium]|nr:hypothetical protein [Hyphomonadaceae bacterium]